MPNIEPLDVFFYLPLAPKIDPYILLIILLRDMKNWHLRRAVSARHELGPGVGGMGVGRGEDILDAQHLHAFVNH